MPPRDALHPPSADIRPPLEVEVGIVLELTRLGDILGVVSVLFGLLVGADLVVLRGSQA